MTEQTELQFLLDLLLNHKLQAQTKKSITERIGVVEQAMRSKPHVAPHMPMPPVFPLPQTFGPTAQAPSTLANLAAHNPHGIATEETLPPVAQIMTAAPLKPPPISARVVGGEVATGKGTRGPRKF